MLRFAQHDSHFLHFRCLRDLVARFLETRLNNQDARSHREPIPIEADEADAKVVIFRLPPGAVG